MNFREHFEAWHKATYGYVGKRATHDTYQTTACQHRWEAWQACGNWHTGQELEKQQPQASFNAAIDFAVKQGSDAAGFLRAWREGDMSEWPEFKEQNNEVR